MKIISLLKPFIGWPLSILSLFFILRFVLPKGIESFRFLASANYFLLSFGIFSFVLYFFIRSYLWRQILKAKGVGMPFREIAFLWSNAEIKRFIPGFFWTPFLKTVLFSNETINKKTIFSCLIIEFIAVGLSGIFLATFSLPFIFEYFILPLQTKKILTIIGIIFASFLCLIFIFQQKIITIIENHVPAFKSSIKLRKVSHFFLPRFTPKTSFIILCTAVIAHIFFGFGTYLVTASVVYITPALVLQMICFFVLSFIIGYFSFFTPMGLGIREGIMLAGLSKIMPLASAGFVSIFARLIFILAELIFISLVYLWNKSRLKALVKLEKMLSAHKLECVVVSFFILYIIYFTIISFLRYENFYTGRFDLGNMAQTVWNTQNGRIFQLTDPNGTEIISRLAFHADFILILLSPFYFLWTDPRMLLIIQTIILAAGAFFVFLLAQRLIGNKLFSSIIAIAYLFNPGIQHSNLYDFHPVTLATTFLLASFYFLFKKRFLLFVVFGIFAAITKEHVWLIFGLMNLYLVLLSFFSKKKNFKVISFGIAAFLICLGIFLFLVSVAIPQARGNQHFALTYYADFGSSPGEIAKNILLSPDKTIATFLQADRLIYFFQLFIPFGFLPIFSPHIVIFAIPDLLVNLLSNNSQLRQIYLHYTATITPFLFIATIISIKNIRWFFPKIPLSFFTLVLCITTIFGAWDLGPLPFAKNPNLDMIVRQKPNKKVISEFLKKIPKKYSVAATNNLGSHLSHREKIFTIPVGVEEADIIAFLLGDVFAQPSQQTQFKMVQDFKKDRRYQLLFEKDDFVVFKKTSG